MRPALSPFPRATLTTAAAVLTPPHLRLPPLPLHLPVLLIARRPAHAAAPEVTRTLLPGRTLPPPRLHLALPEAIPTHHLEPIPPLFHQVAPRATRAQARTAARAAVTLTLHLQPTLRLLQRPVPRATQAQGRIVAEAVVTRIPQLPPPVPRPVDLAGNPPTVEVKAGKVVAVEVGVRAVRADSTERVLQAALQAGSVASAVALEVASPEDINNRAVVLEATNNKAVANRPAASRRNPLEVPTATADRRLASVGLVENYGDGNGRSY